MRRRLSLLAGVCLLAAGLTTATASHADAPLHDWKAPVGGVFRTGQTVDGEWVWTSGLWLAKGANSDAVNRTDYYSLLNPGGDQPTHIPRDVYRALTYDFFGAHRLTHNGDYQLPVSSAYPDGTGEVAEVRAAADAKNLYVRLLWNSMPSKDAQIATLTFDSARAGESVTNDAAWPANARLQSAYTTAVTLSGAGAVTNAGRKLTSRIDLQAHTTEVVIPRSLLPAGALAVGGGSGLADPADPSHYWNVPLGVATPSAPGSGGLRSTTNVWELFFARDTPWTFDELQQSRELNFATATSAQRIDPAALAAAAPVRNPIRTGDFSVMFQSSYFGGDGIQKSRDGLAPVGLDQVPVPLPVQTTGFNESWTYTGRLQEYAMHVPAAVAKSPDVARPLVVYLHGFTGTPEEPFTNPIGLVDAIDKQGWLMASALGRGDLSYSGIGDLDVMEVIKDVEAHYKVDPDRIYLMGHSMGGYGTDNVATHHPDLFAAVAPAEGTASTDIATNLRDVPWFVMTADEDIDPLAQKALAFYNTLSAQGLDATALEYRMKTHEYSSIYDTLPRLIAFFKAHKRVVNPAIVTWGEQPVSAASGPTSVATSPAAQNGAYWLSDMHPYNTAEHSSVTVESYGIAHVSSATMATSATRIDKSVNEGGPTGRTLAQLHQTVPGGTKAAVSRRLDVTAANVRTVTLDLVRAGLGGSGAITINVSTQSPLTIRLVNGSHTTTVTVATGTHSISAAP